MEQVEQSTKRSRTAIEASRSNVFNVEPERLLIVGHDTDHKSKAEHPLYQKRAHESVDMSLAQNMAENGFTTVIDVRKDGPNLEVVVGRRRVKAARVANEMRAAKGLPPIKVVCQVTRGNDIAMVCRMISENALHKDVSPMVMAEDLQGLLAIGATEEEAARASGKSVQQLRQTLKLLDLDVSVQQAIQEGSITATAGTLLADLTREDQKTELARILSGQAGKTVASVASTVRARKTGEEAVQAPGKRLLNKLVAHERSEEIFGTEGLRALKFAMGEMNPQQIEGLSDLLAEIKG